MILVFVFIISSCDIFEDAFTIPSWAQGKWYPTEAVDIVLVEVRPLAFEITSKEFIPSATLNSLPGVELLGIERKDVTLVSGDTVIFDTFQVQKGGAGEVELGLTGVSTGTITFYR